MNFPNVVRFGSTGPAIQSLQEFLGPFVTRWCHQVDPRIVHVGIYDRGTFRAVRMFQRLYDLPKTGRLDPLTLGALRKLWNFDLVEEARQLGGKATLVQKAGVCIEWSPTLEA